jgi:hypothetical protein
VGLGYCSRVNSTLGYYSAALRGRQGLRPLFRWTPRLFSNLSLISMLALATTEQPPSRHRRVIQTPPSSDIKIARLRFLFVLRLRTRNDLRDQADLASARLLTIGVDSAIALALRACSS